MVSRSQKKQREEQLLKEGNQEVRDSNGKLFLQYLKLFKWYTGWGIPDELFVAFIDKDLQTLDRHRRHLQKDYPSSRHREIVRKKQEKQVREEYGKNLKIHESGYKYVDEPYI